MSLLNFIFGIVALIVVFLIFVSWLCIKYGIVERDEKNKKLEIELKKLKAKEEARKKSHYKKSGENLKKGKIKNVRKS